MLRVPAIAAALLVLTFAARAEVRSLEDPGLAFGPVPQALTSVTQSATAVPQAPTGVPQAPTGTQAAPHFSFWGDEGQLPPLNNLIIQIHKAIFVAAILAHTRLGLD